MLAVGQSLVNNDLKICLHGGYFPYKIKKIDGSWDGYDVAIMKDFSSYLQKKPQFIDVEWVSIIPSLLSKKCDVISVGLVKNAEREKVVLYGDNVYDNNLVLIMLKNPVNLSKFKSISDFIRQKKTVGVAQGTSSALFAAKTNLNTVVFKTFDAPILALLEHKVDAVIFEDHYIVSLPTEVKKKIFILDDKVNKEEVSAAFRLEDKSLQQKFNHFLKIWLKTNKKKNYENLYFNSKFSRSI